MSDVAQLAPAELLQLANRSERLKSRRFIQLEFGTADADRIFTQVQGRGWDAATALSPEELEDMISTIGTIGQLSPIQLEHLSDGTYRLVAGERRLRAMKWGNTNHPENPHFHQIAATVVDGPLTDEDRLTWQLVENLARQDLKPGELAAALLYERCAVLATRLVSNGTPIPTKVNTIDDPIERWEALDKLRLDAGHTGIGAPWPEVLKRIGLQLSPNRAKRLVAAFRAMPQELTAEMDETEISLHSRQEWLRLRNGRQEAADEIWEAIKTSGRPELLTSASAAALAHPDADVDDILELAEHQHDRTPATEPSEGDHEDPPAAVLVSAEAAIAEIEALLVKIRQGHTPEGYERGSLVLKTRELLSYLTEQDAKQFTT